MESRVLKVRHWVATVVVLVALAGGALLSQGFKNWTGHTVFGAPGTPIAITQNALPVSLGNFANGFSAVLKPALPAVVNISSSKVVKPGRNQQSPIFQRSHVSPVFWRSIWTRPRPSDARAEPRLGRHRHFRWNYSYEQSRGRGCD